MVCLPLERNLRRISSRTKFTLIKKSLAVAQTLPTFRHQVFESSGVTLLLLHQNTDLVVQREKQIATSTLRNVIFDLVQDACFFDAPTVRRSSSNFSPAAFPGLRTPPPFAFRSAARVPTSPPRRSLRSLPHTEAIPHFARRLAVTLVHAETNLTASRVSSALLCWVVRCCTRFREGPISPPPPWLHECLIQRKDRKSHCLSHVTFVDSLLQHKPPPSPFFTSALKSFFHSPFFSFSFRP